MTRIMDVCLSLLGLLILSPLFVLVSVFILMDSGTPIFYIQKRVGKKKQLFSLIKFRTMKKDSSRKGLLTVGAKDSRITNIGVRLRKYKLDELPQLLNVLKGEMAIVGPRPEVSKYVEMYSEEQMQVLNVKPGITDLASIEYINENEILAASKEPEKTYINEIMPHKIAINLRYLKNKGVSSDLRVIALTVLKIIG